MEWDKNVVQQKVSQPNWWNQSNLRWNTRQRSGSEWWWYWQLWNSMSRFQNTVPIAFIWFCLQFQPTIEHEAWYYSDIARREAEMKCKNTGDCLIRYSSKQNKFILTVNWAGQGKHFIVQQTCNVCLLFLCNTQTASTKIQTEGM